MNKRMHTKIRVVLSMLVIALSMVLLAACGAADSGMRPFKIIEIVDGYPTSVAFSPDGETLAAGARIYIQSTDKWSSAVHLWRSDDWAALPTLTLGEGIMDGGIGIAFSPDGKLLAAAEPNGKVHVWQTSDWMPIKEMEIERGLTALVAFSPDGKTLAANARGSKIALWKVDGWEPLPPLLISEMGANAMSFSPDSQMLATGGDDEEVHVWRISDGTQLQRLRGHTKGITSLAFSPDGQTIATGAYDDTMWFWRVSDGKSLDTWDITPADLLFMAEGESILVSDLWSDPKIFRVSDGAVLAKLDGDPVWDGMSPKGLSLALTPDGKTLAGGTGHGDIWLWKIP
jgi:WD40 repeat protein